MGPNYYLACLAFIIKLIGIGVKIAISTRLWIVVITVLMVETMEATGTFVGNIAIVASLAIWVIITIKKFKNKGTEQK